VCKSTNNSYDTIVVGAGIAGCCSAYMLQLKGQRVLLVDRSAVAASGGSGAAGAFVSPKIGKGSSLQTLTNEAFTFAKEFYIKHFPKNFYQPGVIRIPKDEEDANKFAIYEEFNSTKYSHISKDELEKEGIQNSKDSFLFEDAGVCDAPKMCENIFSRVTFKQFDVKSMRLNNETWILSNSTGETLSAKNVVLSTGHQNSMFDMQYMGVRGTWGSRGDYYSKANIRVSMHKSISVSANIDGLVKIGATHNKAKEPCRVCNGKPLEELFVRASQMVDTSDFKLKETFCGMRSGSKDYFPLVGKVIDVEFMLQTYPKVLKGAKPPLKHMKNIYICNGLGGRGFVFAPLMAKLLAEHIVDGEPMDARVNPDRLFLKWCRKPRKE